MKSYRIPEIAKKYVEYDMIQTHTDLPEFPDSRARLLFAFLANGRHSAQLSELYALVVSLVQLGLDTHDTIDDDREKRPEAGMRERQLKVLAGDYFSSRFYHLLSQAGQIDMIRKISGAICEVNRVKLNLYMRMKQLKVTADEYIGMCTDMKTGLFELFGALLEGRASRLWPELLRGLSRCEVVAHELDRMESPGRFERSWGYWHVMQEGTDADRKWLAERAREEGVVSSLVAKYDIRSQLHDKLRQSVQHVQSIAAGLESDKLASELAGIGERFLRPFAAQQAIYNEMG